MWGPGVGAGAAWMVAAPDAAPAAGAPAATGGGSALGDTRSQHFSAVAPPPRGVADGHGGGLAAAGSRQWDDLDIVLAMDGGAATGFAAGSGAVGAARQAAAREAGHLAGASSPLPLSALRCLDSEHPAGCDRCVPPPSREEEGDFELCGDPGKKNGEKKLRALLCRTPEWSDSEARLRVAAACAAHADALALETLAAVMSGRSTSAALRKSDLLHLTRCWNFRSDLWCRRNARKRAAPFPDAPPPPLAPRRAEVKAAARAAAAAAAANIAAKQAAAAAKATSRLNAAAAYGCAPFGTSPPYGVATGTTTAQHQASAAPASYGSHGAALYAAQQQQQAQALHMFGFGGGTGGAAAFPFSQYAAVGGGGTTQHPSTVYSAQCGAAAMAHSSGPGAAAQRPPPALQLPAALGGGSLFGGGPVSPLGDIWSGYGLSAPPPPPPPPPPPAAAAPVGSFARALGSAAGLDAVSICAYIRSALAPLAGQAAAAFGGPDARDAALLFGAAHVTPSCAAQVAAAAAAAAATAAVWRARCAETAAQAGAVSAEGSAAVAWQCFLGAPLPMDRWLAELPDALHAEEAACPSRSIRLGDAPLTPAEIAWTQELRRGRLSALELVNHLQSLVAQVKLASLGTCLRVVAAAAEVVATYTAAVATQLAARAAWMRELIASGRGGADAAQLPRGRPLFVWVESLPGAAKAVKEAGQAGVAEATVECHDNAPEKDHKDDKDNGTEDTLKAADIVAAQRAAAEPPAVVA